MSAPGRESSELPPGAPGHAWDVSTEAMRWRPAPPTGTRWVIRCSTCDTELVAVDFGGDLSRDLAAVRRACNKHRRIFPHHEVRGYLFNDGDEYEATPPPPPPLRRHRR